jgi:hypothetical protein
MLQEPYAKWCTTTCAAIMLVKATDSTSNGLKGASKVVKRHAKHLITIFVNLRFSLVSN